MEKQTLWKKFKKSSVNLGKSSVYESIILFYTMKKKELPNKAKFIILAALSYYVLTIDFIPDIAAIIGIGLLDDVLAIAVAHKYVMRHADADSLYRQKYNYYSSNLYRISIAPFWLMSIRAINFLKTGYRFSESSSNLNASFTFCCSTINALTSSNFKISNSFSFIFFAKLASRLVKVALSIDPPSKYKSNKRSLFISNSFFSFLFLISSAFLDVYLYHSI